MQIFLFLRMDIRWQRKFRYCWMMGGVEERVGTFIGERRELGRDNLNLNHVRDTMPFELVDECWMMKCEEEKALTVVENSTVDLLSSKSLINHYACCIPMDVNSRSSREICFDSIRTSTKEGFTGKSNVRK